MRVPGAAFSIWWMMPGSVPTMKVSVSVVVVAYFRSEEVDPRVCVAQEVGLALGVGDDLRVGVTHLQSHLACSEKVS